MPGIEPGTAESFGKHSSPTPPPLPSCKSGRLSLHVAGLGEPLFGAETFLGLFLEPIKANLIQALTYKSEEPSKYDEAKDFQFKLHRTTNFLAEKKKQQLQSRI